MCFWCWQRLGSPTDLPDNAELIIALIKELYVQPDGGTGGPLHVELDDFNVETEWRPWRDVTWHQRTLELATQIGDLVRPLPVSQRAALVAAADGYFDIEDVGR